MKSVVIRTLCACAMFTCAIAIGVAQQKQDPRVGLKPGLHDAGEAEAVWRVLVLIEPGGGAESVVALIELRDLVVYELQVEEFNSTFDGVIDRLDYLQGLGVNCLELMPVTHV